jgi:hypothetical protein
MANKDYFTHQTIDWQQTTLIGLIGLGVLGIQHLKNKQKKEKR